MHCIYGFCVCQSAFFYSFRILFNFCISSTKSNIFDCEYYQLFYHRYLHIKHFRHLQCSTAYPILYCLYLPSFSVSLKRLLHFIEYMKTIFLNLKKMKSMKNLKTFKMFTINKKKFSFN